METDEERKARLENMVPTSTTPLIRANMSYAVAVVLSLKPILSFKLDVLTTSAPTTERNIDQELLSASLILLDMYLITYTL